MTDMEILGLLKEHPAEGLEAAVKQYTAYVFRIAGIRLGAVCTREDIEEAVSDIFLKFYTAGLKNGFEFESVRGCLSVIAGRHCINMFNKQCRKVNAEIPLDEIIELPLPDNENELGRRLTDAIEKLGEPDSEIFLRKYFFGQKTADIAKELRMRPNTVDKRISRGLVRLRKILEEE